jgi:hypothetical protein
LHTTQLILLFICSGADKQVQGRLMGQV